MRREVIRLCARTGEDTERERERLGRSIPVYLELCDSWVTGQYISLQLRERERERESQFFEVL